MPRHERSHRWYLIAGIVVVLFLFFSILRGDWSFAVVIALVAGVYFLVHRKPPPEKRIDIRSSGIVFDGDVVPWSSCQGFFFLQGPDYVELHFERKDRKEDIVIQTGDLKIDELHALLIQLLPELPNRRERLLDSFTRSLKL